MLISYLFVTCFLNLTLTVPTTSNLTKAGSVQNTAPRLPGILWIVTVSAIPKPKSSVANASETTGKLRVSVGLVWRVVDRWDDLFQEGSCPFEGLTMK